MAEVLYAKLGLKGNFFQANDREQFSLTFDLLKEISRNLFETFCKTLYFN